MNAFWDMLASASLEPLGWTLLHSIWQFALLAVVVSGALAAMRRRSAEVRYLTACIGLVAMIGVGMGTFWWLGAGRTARSATTTATEEETEELIDTGDEADGIITAPFAPRELADAGPSSVAAADQRMVVRGETSPDAARTVLATLSRRLAGSLGPWLPWVSLAWLGGVIVVSLRHLGGWVGVQRLRWLGTTTVSPDLSQRARQLMDRMKISRPVRILQSTLAELPIVVGWLRPVVLLPASLLTGLSPKQLEAVLAHELAHVRRHDYLVNLLQTAAETMLFYHPAVWWLSRRIRIEREHCCDDVAVAVCRNKVDYAEALAAVEQRRAAALAMAVGVRGPMGSALGRVRRVLGISAEDRVRSAQAIAGSVAALLLIGVFAGYLALANEPKRNPEPPPADDSAAQTGEDRKKRPADSDPMAQPVEQDEQANGPAVQVEGESEVSQLLTALEDHKYAHTRGGIIPLVKEIGNREPTSFLVEQLQAGSRERRCQAALLLELLGDRRGVPAIIKELSDTSYRPTERIRSDRGQDQQAQIRQDHYYAALLLGILGDDRAVPALIKATQDETVDYRAATSLGQIGDRRAIPALRDMLERCRNKPFPRLFAAYGLAMLSNEAGLKVVIDTLNDHQQHWTIRRHAIEALGQLRDKVAVPSLIAALKDEHPNIRVSAARALGAVGDRSALPALKQALEDNTKTKVNAPTTVSEAAAKAIDQIEGETTCVEGLRCSAELSENELAFGQRPELAVSLTNTTAEPIDVLGYCRNPKVHCDRYPLPCAQLAVSPVVSKHYRISSYDFGARPEAIRIAPGESWSFRFPPPKMEGSTTTGEHSSLLPSLSACPPGKYTAQLSYFIRESEVEKFGTGLVFGAEMGSLAGKKPDRLWQGVVQSKELVFEVLDDDSEQLRIRKAVDRGEGLENLELELKASETKVLLSLVAKNTGQKTVYLGGRYCLRGRNPMGEDAFPAMAPGQDVPMELKPGSTLELGGWNLSSIAPGTYWVEYLSNLSPERVLKKSNTVTFAP